MTNLGNNTIGEYNTDGTTENASLVSDPNGPFGIAVSGSDLFVVGLGGSVGEYTTDGATVNASLVTGLNVPYDIAVVVPEPSTWMMFLAGFGILILWHMRARRHD